MRLTNYHREAIAGRAIAATFDPQKAALVEQEHELGMRFYEHLIPASERRAASKLGKRWITWDSCLRFNVGGPNLRFDVKEPVPVPANAGYCTPLGALEGEMMHVARSHHDALKELKERCQAASRQLRSLLASVTTLSMLEETWPEGRPFYEHFGGASRLPVPIISDINAALGLVAA